jgi:hypothetical protein
MSAASSSARHRRAPAGEPLAHLLAADQLHGNEGVAVGFVDVVDDGDVGVLDRRRGLGFLDEAPAAFRIVDQFLGQDLEGDVAIETGVSGAIDQTHAAAADLLGDVILGEPAARQAHGVCAY